MRKNKNSPTIWLPALIMCIALMQSCGVSQITRTQYRDVNKALHATENLRVKPFIKAHMKNGDLCIFLESWRIDTVQHAIVGKATRYDPYRNRVFYGEMTLPADSLALIESNSKDFVGSERIAGLAILAGLDVAFGIYCLVTPKACFGSCPTFYLEEGQDLHYSDAEGFSDAILPSMEKHDIDALNNGPVHGETFSIIMKNEALETHCVKELKLLAYPRKTGERVFHSPSDDFFLCRGLFPPRTAGAEEGDITDLLHRADIQERFSLADGSNLNSKEEIYLTFDNPAQTATLGLVMHYRQTLMTTYFIYSALGYMGDEVGDILAKAENDKALAGKLHDGIVRELGGIDVFEWNISTNDWEYRGSYREIGPIALNKQILPLGNAVPGSPVRIKLVLNKGLWRIDYIALTEIKELVRPIDLSPQQIWNKGVPDAKAMSLLHDPDRYLVSMPGSEYKIEFGLPGGEEDYELFLHAKGYYLEWMRENWIQEKNLLKLRQMFENPQKYLKAEARDYKRYEAMMEQEFWGTKIDTKNFSYENAN